MAIKYITKQGKSQREIENIRKEIDITRTLQHENIIHMLDAFETKRDFCLVMEYAQVRGYNDVIPVRRGVS